MALKVAFSTSSELSKPPHNKRKGQHFLSSHKSEQTIKKRLFMLLWLIFIMGALPFIALLFIALSGDNASLAHLWQHVIPRASLTTLFLLLGVGIFSAMIGTMGAWLVTFFEFPLRRLLTWAMVMPLAIPPYIAAYHFSEFFSFTGPLQELIRSIGGYNSIRDYAFPNMNSIGGGIIILTSVLFPYNYLAAFAIFRLQGGAYVVAARSLQAPKLIILWRILLPLAWPAILAGTMLVLMESLNDIGAVEYLGIETLTFSIYATWLNRGDVAGASQLALLLFSFLMLLWMVEHYARRRNHAAMSSAPSNEACHNNSPLIARQRLCHPCWRFIPTLLCIIPLIPGLIITLYMIVKHAFRHSILFFDTQMWEAAFNSFLLGIIAAFFTIAIAAILIYIQRFIAQKDGFFMLLIRLVTSGYAMPGTIIALGLFIPLAVADNIIDKFMQYFFHISTGLLFSGSLFILIYAYIIRFMAIAEGDCRAGLDKISRNFEFSARSLGLSYQGSIMKITLPQLKPVFMIAGLMVFIETIKELSATLFLRPIGFQSLSTHIYDLASQAKVEDTAFASLLIIILGAISAFLLMYKMIDDKPKIS